MAPATDRSPDSDGRHAHHHGPASRIVSGPRRERHTTPALSSWIDEFFNRSAGSWTMWSPRADVYEISDAYVLEMELAGFHREDVEATLDEGLLRVHLPKLEEARPRRIEVKTG